MQKEFWHQKWQCNDIGFNQQQPHALLIQYFGTLNLRSGQRVFVPLCGKSVDMLWLLNQSIDVVGVELSSIACEAFFSEHDISFSKTQVGKFSVYQGKNISLLCGDFFDLTPAILGHIDAVYDRAALIALPTDIRQHYASFTKTLFERNTPVLLLVVSYDQSRMNGPPFSVDKAEIVKLYGKHIHLKQLCSQSVQPIPSHLGDKGLTVLTEQAYYLRLT